MNIRLVRPGLRFGSSPVNRSLLDRRSGFDRFVARCLGWLQRKRFDLFGSMLWLEALDERIRRITSLSLEQRDAERARLVTTFRQRVEASDSLDEALAHACVAAVQTLGVEPRDNQRLSARALLNGYFAELATGEGKTLSIALAASAAALSGTPVHVLTANEYLTGRDADNLMPLYAALGLQASCALSSLDPVARRKAYAADIVYVTGKQVAFDWLSDALAARSDSGSLVARLGPLAHPSQSTTYQPMMRGLCLAIVDEADSLLVDEARIPLVLSAAQQAHSVTDTEAAIALGLAEQLRESVDYRVMPTSRFVELTEAGREELQRLSLRVSACWKSTRYRDERVGQALSVIHRFRRDRDYIVREGRLELLDAHTGRAMPERRLQQGLHRLLELKERCALTPDHEIVASIPVQHFFRRYLALVGLSGTLREVRGEIHRVYDSHMVYVQTHRPSARTVLPARVFADRASQLQALVDELHRRSDIGQPVLVCTRSVEQSSGVSAMLTAHGMDHRVLNAYQDAEEAAIVARAGQQKQITVATSMAGRGTDIEPGPGVVGLGGLHVISLAFNDARRLDRQLAGRAARQGDPGSCQQLHCLDDPFLVDALPAFWRGIALRCVRNHWQRLALQLIRLTQHRRW